MKDKIAIIGPYPPPFGGISVHVKRVLEHLPPGSFKLYNYNKSEYPSSRSFYGKKKHLIFFLFFFHKYRLIHCHSADPLVRLQFSFLGFFRSNVYLHIHNERLIEEIKRKRPGAFLLRRWLKNVNIITVSSSVTETISKYNPLSIQKIEAFIPPVFKLKAIKEFMETYKDFFRKDRFVISMTGWFDYYNDEDLYGFDLAIEMLKRIHDQEIPLSLVVTINGIRVKRLFNSFNDYIEEHGLQNNVLQLKNFPEGWLPILASQLFIRPTNTDGDAVSIREALWVGTPVITSDCVQRPEGSILFKNRSVDDLCKKVLEHYNKPWPVPEDRFELFRTKPFKSKLFSDVYKFHI